MANRLLLAISFLVIGCNNGEVSEPEDSFVLPLVSIDNTVVRDSIKNYYQRNLSPYSKGVVTINSTNENDTTRFIISSTLSSFGMESSPPSFFAEFDSIPVLIYTGYEKIILMDNEYISQIRARTHAYLDEIPPNYNPVVWEVAVVEKKVVGSRVLN